jgi:hypothetical protein
MAPREFWGVRRPFYKPNDITAPVLLFHCAWDCDANIAQAQAYFLELTRTPYKRWVEVGEATNMVALERHRFQAYEAT